MNLLEKKVFSIIFIVLHVTCFCLVHAIYVNGYQTFTPIYIVKFVTDDYCFLVNLLEKGVLNHFYCFTW